MSKLYSEIVQRLDAEKQAKSERKGANTLARKQTWKLTLVHLNQRLMKRSLRLQLSLKSLIKAWAAEKIQQMESEAETRILAVEDTADPGKSKLRALEKGAWQLEIVGGQGTYTTSDSQRKLMAKIRQFLRPGGWKSWRLKKIQNVGNIKLYSYSFDNMCDIGVLSIKFSFSEGFHSLYSLKMVNDLRSDCSRQHEMVHYAARPCQGLHQKH